MVLRVLIGLGEAFVNNTWIFLSVWYTPKELALRSGESFKLLNLLAHHLVNYSMHQVLEPSL